jgi:regulator of protease activity HflC (stomatin/prohibitin superfamily)
VRQGIERSYRSEVRNTVESHLRTRLAELSSDDWFDADLRLTKLSEIEESLNEGFAGGYAEVESVLVHDIKFSSQYEQELQLAQILDQQQLQIEADTRLELAKLGKETIESETEAAKQAATTEAEQARQELQAQHDRDVAEITARADHYRVEQRAEADRTYAELVAEGQLAVDRAKALGDRLRLEILDGDGGRRYLAQRAAANLEIERVTLNSNDPGVPSVLDIDELVGLLIGSDE